MRNAIALRGAVPDLGHGPWSARAVANTLLVIADEHGEQLDALKLQKLVYYAHGWSLALLGRPLIDEEIQAWQYGPVVASVYHEFKRFGRRPIPELAADIADDGNLYTPIISLSATEERHLLERVWQTYGRYSGVQLSNMTHEPGTPWRDAWDENREGLRFYGIDNDLIRRRFLEKYQQQR